jgi:hypothetical protein
MLLGHLSQQHPNLIGLYFDQMRGAEDIGAARVVLMDMDRELFACTPTFV